MSKFMTRQQAMTKETIIINTAVSSAIDIRDFSAGIVITSAAWTAANIGIKVSQAEDGTFVILRDILAAPVQISGIATAASNAYVLPDEVFAAGFIKLWSKHATAATETDVNQGAERSLWVLLKS